MLSARFQDPFAHPRQARRTPQTLWLQIHASNGSFMYPAFYTGPLSLQSLNCMIDLIKVLTIASAIAIILWCPSCDPVH